MENHPLNPRQKEAVETTDGPLLILAGAGAGKTRTVVERILHIIQIGVAPENILAITFTNKTAKEMRDRLNRRLEEDKEINRPVSMRQRPFVSTFHSLGVHILKENSRLLSIPRHFSIFDKSDSKRTIKEALGLENLDPKQFDPGFIQNIISKEKGRFVSAEEYGETADSEYIRGVVARVWLRYESILAREKALDFDDLLLKTATFLKNNREILLRYRSIWKYIHIDEYQDTNVVQYAISKLLAGQDKNICVVGDIDQNIYSWRGANLRNILDFEKDYPDAKVVVLEQNYRSTKTILAVANSVIEKNRHRKDKKLFTENPTGEKVGVFVGFDEIDEADFVTTKAAELIRKGTPAEEIAVLFRANFQSRALEEVFLQKNIPYQLLGVRFFERKEVKDVLSFVRAALNPESFSDIKRIVNVPPRGIGKITLLKMFSGGDGLAGTIKKKVDDFKKLLASIKERALTEKPSEVIKFVIKAARIEEAYGKKTDEDKERLENVRELATLAAKYDIFTAGIGMEKLLEDAVLMSDQDELAETGKGVKLMTVHASKGLEFDYVFVTGLEDGLFPHERGEAENMTPEEAEEERRLFYVAVTRARKKLFLSYVQVRTIFGSRQMTIPSEFVSDIDASFVETEEFQGECGSRKPLIKIEF